MVCFQQYITELQGTKCYTKNKKTASKEIIIEGLDLFFSLISFGRISYPVCCPGLCFAFYKGWAAMSTQIHYLFVRHSKPFKNKYWNTTFL